MMDKLYQQNYCICRNLRGEKQRQIRREKLNVVELLSEGGGSRFLC